MPIRNTVLHALHTDENATFSVVNDTRVPFYFRSIEVDYSAARARSGLADLGFYDLIRIRGEDRLKFFNQFVTQDITKYTKGEMHQLIVANDEGFIVDMPQVFFLESFILLMISPGRSDDVIDLISEDVPDSVEVESFNDAYTPLALIGPKCDEVLKAAMREDFVETEPSQAVVGSIFTARVIMANTVMFGEPAYILLVGLGHAETAYKRLKEAGGENMRSIGLGTLEQLRLESGEAFPGYETYQGIMPVELGLMKMVNFDKRIFYGREPMFQAAQFGREEWLVGFKMHDKMIPRRQMQVLHDNQPAGFVTSGSFSPQLNCGIGLALIKRPIATNGTILQLARRNSFYTAEIVARPFFRNPLSKGMHRR